MYLVSDISAGDGKIANLFLQCMALLPAQDNAYNCMLKASKSTLCQLLERRKRKRDDQGDASLCILNMAPLGLCLKPEILHSWGCRILTGFPFNWAKNKWRRTIGKCKIAFLFDFLEKFKVLYRVNFLQLGLSSVIKCFFSCFDGRNWFIFTQFVKLSFTPFEFRLGGWG